MIRHREQVILHILYASETGNAQEVAENLQREAERRRFRTLISDMDGVESHSSTAAVVLPSNAHPSHKLDNATCTYAIFITSVRGEGEPPRNMVKSWRWLLRKVMPSLNHLRFAVFGCGDSSYTLFNFPAKKLHKRLLGLGAKPLLSRGDGDDQHPLGLDGALVPWLEELWQVLDREIPLSKGLSVIPENIVPASRFKVEFEDLDPLFDAHKNDLPIMQALDIRSVIIRNDRITNPAHFQDVRHIEMDILDVHSRYHIGDAVMIKPENLSHRVNAVLKHFSWEDIADRPFTLIARAEGYPIPSSLRGPQTLRKCLTSSLDIFGPPRRYFFQLLSFFATNPLQAQKLQEFASPEGQQDLFAYCHRMKRTAFEVIQDFDSIKLPIAYLFDIVRELKPRYFSISSCPMKYPGKIHLTVAVVEYRTKMSTPRIGICSNWLAALPIGHVLSCRITPGSLKIPKSDVPLILVAPGTGIAPIRAIIQSRMTAENIGETVLFCGFRNEANDFLYAEEWKAYERAKRLTLISAFSRDQEDTVYVQHKITENAALVYSLISRGAVILVCGNSKMPKYVKDAILEDVLIKEGQMELADATEYMTMMVKKHRFQIEAW